MNSKLQYPIAVAAVFTWIGAVCAISFLEAWLKFQAPGITIPLGLGIGRLVFQALNKVEIILALIIYANIFYSGYLSIKKYFAYIIITSIVLIIQTFGMLPVLDTRAEMYITGHTPPSSNLHFYYVITEVIKVGCLSIFGTKLIKI